MPRSRRRHGDLDAPGGISRRSFLIGGAAVAGVALGLWRLRARRPPPPGPEPGDAAVRAAPPYGDWRDVYRERWRWDRVACGTHTSANCVAACAWNLYVRDGVVWREEQSAP